MTTSKKILFAVMIVLIVGAIWYLESIQAHPGAGSGSGGQAISYNASTTPMLSGDASSTVSPAATKTPAAVQSSIEAIASADQKAGDKPAIEISDPTGFVNVSSSFTLGSLIGKKVILLDFWTYSCINCLRTLPYLTGWYAKYKNEGLEVVGIHTPEFDFEKNITNVEAAATQYGITYPIVLDSNYGTWDAYGNLYWPHEYLIDIAGYIVHDQVGEGSYGETEGTIQQLLTQRAVALGIPTSIVSTGTLDVAPANLNEINSPETYFGAARNEYLANGEPQTPGIQNLTAPQNAQSTMLNSLYLVGAWDFEDQYATNIAAGAKIIYEYDSGKVYFVASGGSGTGVSVEVMQDGQPVTAADAGADVHNGSLLITGSRLYSVINNPTPGEHTLELIVNSPGLQAYTFTFG